MMLKAKKDRRSQIDAQQKKSDTHKIGFRNELKPSIQNIQFPGFKNDTSDPKNKSDVRNIHETVLDELKVEQIRQVEPYSIDDVVSFEHAMDGLGSPAVGQLASRFTEVFVDESSWTSLGVPMGLPSANPATLQEQRHRVELEVQRIQARSEISDEAKARAKKIAQSLDINKTAASLAKNLFKKRGRRQSPMDPKEIFEVDNSDSDRQSVEVTEIEIIAPAKVEDDELDALLLLSAKEGGNGAQSAPQSKLSEKASHDEPSSQFKTDEQDVENSSTDEAERFNSEDESDFFFTAGDDQINLYSSQSEAVIGVKEELRRYQSRLLSMAGELESESHFIARKDSLENWEWEWDDLEKPKSCGIDAKDQEQVAERELRRDDLMSIGDDLDIVERNLFIRLESLPSTFNVPSSLSGPSMLVEAGEDADCSLVASTSNLSLSSEKSNESKASSRSAVHSLGSSSSCHISSLMAQLRAQWECLQQSLEGTIGQQQRQVVQNDILSAAMQAGKHAGFNAVRRSQERWQPDSELDAKTFNVPENADRQEQNTARPQQGEPGWKVFDGDTLHSQAYSPSEVSEVSDVDADTPWSDVPVQLARKNSYFSERSSASSAQRPVSRGGWTELEGKVSGHAENTSNTKTEISEQQEGFHTASSKDQDDDHSHQTFGVDLESETIASSRRRGSRNFYSPPPGSAFSADTFSTHNFEARTTQRRHSRRSSLSSTQGETRKNKRRLVLDKKIGAGATGVVWKGCLTGAGLPDEVVAVKKLKEPATPSSTQSSTRHEFKRVFQMEVSILRKLNHKNIVKYRGVQVTPHTGELNLVLEYCEGGSLKHYIEENGPLLLDPILDITKQLLEGVAYLHHQGIIHRDIKPSNILTHFGAVKIADFDVSTQVLALQTMTRTAIGTPHYMAPEVILGEHYSSLADIWSIGCTILELSTGEMPFGGINGIQVLFKISQGMNPPVTKLEKMGGYEENRLLIPFFNECWKRPASDRPSAATLIKYCNRLRQEK